MKGGVQVYAKLPARFIFIEYCCEGVSSDSNEIYVSLDSEKFLRTLRQINKHSKSVKLKLVRKGSNSFIEIVIEQAVSSIETVVYSQYTNLQNIF